MLSLVVHNQLPHSMRLVILSLICLTWLQGFGQISGNVSDALTGDPIPYVNVWIKNTAIGGTTGIQGQFYIDQGKVGDTLLITNLGYLDLILIAEPENLISLVPHEIELSEVVIRPMRKEIKREIRTYDKYSRLSDFYYNGHYSLARYFPYSEAYAKYPFIQKITLVTTSALKDVKFKVYLLNADENGYPTARALSDYHVMVSGKGKSEITIDFQNERILLPKSGFFVIVDRLNLEENKFSNKLAKDILQPAIGMENYEQPMQTWMTFGGRWLTPEELSKNPGWKNIAVNVELSD